MCLLALFFRAVPDAAVVVGANPEEAYARGSTPPRLLDGPCRAIAGVDPQAGGTWLGVNEHGVLIAVTNRSRWPLPDQPRSRGLLARDLLACPTAAAAVQRAVAELDHGHYAGCNILCVDANGATVVHAADWLRVWPLPPGLHVLTNRDVNAAGDPRTTHALGWLGQRDYANSAECVAALAKLCAQTGAEGPAMCLHGDQGGTVSSSIIALRSPLARSLYLHAQGPPDQASYADYSALFGGLAAGS